MTDKKNIDLRVHQKENIDLELQQQASMVTDTLRTIKDATNIILDVQRDKTGHIFALSARMKGTRSYMSSVSLHWISDMVGYASRLPMFNFDGPDYDAKDFTPVHRKINIKDIRKVETMSALQQRQPDWRRQLPMVVYLITKETPKFPPILVVGYQPWVYDKNAWQWGEDGIALKDSIQATPMDSKQSYYDLDLSDTFFYAIDGQHRLMAISGLQALLRDGFIYSMSRNHEKGNKKVTIDDIVEVVMDVEKRTGIEVRTKGEIKNYIETLTHQTIGIEIIPAVMAGEKYSQALKRLRRTFVDVNSNAKKPTKSDSILLDEENGFHIVARNLMASHDLLRGRTSIGSQLGDGSLEYTTLETISEIAASYLTRLSPKWKTLLFNISDCGLMRPPEKEIEEAIQEMHRYFDTLTKLPSHRACKENAPVEQFRNSEHDHILFRPITQMALADAIADLKDDTDLQRIVEELARKEEEGLLKLQDKTNPWFGILCDTTKTSKSPKYKMRKTKHYRDLCADMFRYLLGHKFENDHRENLRTNYAEARKIDDEHAYDSNGDKVKLDDVKLPSPWL